jgi:WS/DGAT/MGAT family acyltransferase
MLKQLSAQDAQFLYTQTANNLTHIMGVYIYDPSTAPGGFVRFKDIIAHVESRVDTSPLFKRRLHRLPFDLDHPYWVEDEHFDIEAHMSHARLPEPGDWRQFCIAVARHFSKPMDMNRPLWDIYVIEGLDRIPGIPKGSFAMLHRVHHAAVDGASGAHAFIAMSDIDPRGTPVIADPPPPEDLGRAPSSAETVTRAWGASLQSPVKFMNALMKISPAIVSAARKSMADGGMTAGVPETRFNVAVGPHKMFDGTSVALADVAEVRKKVPGATVNDVVLTTVGGALRKYLAKHKELPKESLVAVAPINLRGKGGKASTPGNQVSAMSVPVRTDIADPLERLAAIRDPRLYGRGQGSEGRRQRADHDRPVAAYSRGDDGRGRAAAHQRAVRGARHQSLHLQRPRRAGSALSRGREACDAARHGAARKQYGPVRRDPQL